MLKPLQVLSMLLWHNVLAQVQEASIAVSLSTASIFNLVGLVTSDKLTIELLEQQDLVKCEIMSDQIFIFMCQLTKKGTEAGTKFVQELSFVDTKSVVNQANCIDNCPTGVLPSVNKGVYDFL